MAMATASTTSFLIAICLHRVVFLGNSFTTFRFNVPSIAIIIAANVWTAATSSICLYDAGIRDAQVGGNASEIQTSHFLMDTAFEIADGEIVDEGHL